VSDHDQEWTKKREEAFKLLGASTSRLVLAALFCFLTFLAIMWQCSPPSPPELPGTPPPVGGGDDGSEPPKPDPLPPAEPREHISFAKLEAIRLADQNTLDSREQKQARYLVTTDQWNQSASDETLKVYEHAGSKALNMIAAEAPEVRPIDKVGDGVYRFFLEDYNLSATDWEVIIGADKIKMVSETDTGILLQALTGTRQDWLHVSNFDDIVLSAPVYHRLVGVSATFAEFVQSIGVRFAGDLADRDAVFAGTFESPLAPRTR
jgi:hypothetical protein